MSKFGGLVVGRFRVCGGAVQAAVVADSLTEFSAAQGPTAGRTLLQPHRARRLHDGRLLCVLGYDAVENRWQASPRRSCRQTSTFATDRFGGHPNGIGPTTRTPTSGRCGAVSAISADSCARLRPAQYQHNPEAADPGRSSRLRRGLLELRRTTDDVGIVSSRARPRRRNPDRLAIDPTGCWSRAATTPRVRARRGTHFSARIATLEVPEPAAAWLVCSFVAVAGRLLQPR